MSWQIHNIACSIKVTKAIAQALFEAHCYEGENYGDLWERPADVTDMHRKLYFSSDHSEHMDWIDSHPDLLSVLLAHKVKGEATFLDAESAGGPRMWGYQFDGEGGMQKIKGEITWSVEK